MLDSFRAISSVSGRAKGSRPRRSGGICWYRLRIFGFCRKVVILRWFWRPLIVSLRLNDVIK